jgi:putative acetyltransferase
MYIPNSETWIYEKNGDIIWFISMQGIEIGGLFVLHEHHANSIGTQLVNFILEMYDELEVEVLRKTK